MPTFAEDLPAALEEIDSRSLVFPSGNVARVVATWHCWLAYDELVTGYGWAEAELLELVAAEHAATGVEVAACFATVVAYAYADCRHELAGHGGAETWLPLLPTGHQRRSGAAIANQA
jgi:hypothetical protein